ncbi:MAG: hypothetical protein ABS882_02355 [Lysinibacillus sp.]
MRLFTLGLIFCSLLAGCDFQQIKDAAAGIGDAADQASTAISEEVHSIRAIEITYENETFTVNDLYKGILRDVYWDYESDNNTDLLTVKGTWQPPLLELYGLDINKYPKLDVIGEVFIDLTVIDSVIQEEKTKIKILYEDEVIFEETGATILQQLYADYTK